MIEGVPRHVKHDKWALDNILDGLLDETIEGMITWQSSLIAAV